jgi:hypothetical protein
MFRFFGIATRELTARLVIGDIRPQRQNPPNLLHFLSAGEFDLAA